MDSETCAALLELNRSFYVRFADDFSATRRTWWPGFARILPHLSPAANVLDLGCGNGRLLSFLGFHAWQGSYTGVDSSARLLALAEEARVQHPHIAVRFELADLAVPGWSKRLAPADAVVCLAVLHHLPGVANRMRFVQECAQLLAPEGRLVLSTWQFMGTPRLRARVLPWTAAGLQPAQVEPGDYLLSWGRDAAGQRYCADIGEVELCRLASHAGLTRVEVFAADGLEQNLNLYGIFRLTAR